jgi:hypothetical protein
LGNLAQYACGSKHKLRVALQALRRVLAPIGPALSSSTGADRDLLAMALCKERILGAQKRKIAEISGLAKMDCKYGSNCIAVGVTAAMLVCFATMSKDIADVGSLPRQLELCAKSLQAILRQWRLAGTCHKDVLRSLQVELRALDRAVAGVERARQMAATLSFSQQIELALTFLRRAAWPANVKLDEASQPELLARIKSGELVDIEQAGAGASAVRAPGVVTLAELPAAKRRRCGSPAGSPVGSSVGSPASRICTVGGVFFF